MQSAAGLIAEGRLQEAATSLEQAASLHAQENRSYDEARCLQLAATLHRSAGDPQMAKCLTDRAAEIAFSDQPLAVSIASEQAETAFATDNHQAAVEAWSRALEQAHNAGLNPDGLSAMLRRRALSLIALGKTNDASDDFGEAYRLLEASRGKGTALFVIIEQANAFRQYGYLAEAEQIVSAWKSILGSDPENNHLQAELFIL